MGKYKNLLVNTGLFALNSVATKLISFFLVPFYTAHLTAGEYGLTDMSVTVIGLVGPVATLCVAGAAMRFMVANREQAGQYTAVSTVVTLASVVLVALLSPLLDLGVFGGLGEYRVLFVIAYAMSVLVDLCGNITRGLSKVGLIPLCSVVSAAVTLVSALFTIGTCGMGITGYYVSTISGPAVALVLYATMGGLAGLAAKGLQAFLSDADAKLHIKELCVPMLRYALPLIPNSLFWWAQTSISRLFITGMLSITASGMYAAASKIPNLINTAYTIFQQAWQLSSFQESESDALSGFFETVFRLLQATMTILCAALSLISPWVASVLLRGETYDAWPMIPILLIANLMNVFNTFYGTIYTTTMHTSYVMRTTVVGAVACVVLTPILVLVLGMYGACIASAMSQALVFFMRVQDSRRYVTFDIGWCFLAPTLAALVAQSAVTSLQVDGWQAISAVCLGIVVMIQGVRVAPIVRKVFVMLKDGGARRKRQQ